jgi:diamine N-acetyltransferase
MDKRWRRENIGHTIAQCDCSKMTYASLMRNVNIHVGQAADAEELSPLAMASFVAGWGPIIGNDHAENYAQRQLSPAALRADLATHADSYLLARDAAGALLGYAKVDFAANAPLPVQALLPRSVLLQRLYLAPTAFGSGAAAALHADVTRLAQAHSSGIWLVTDPRNARAWAFYTRLGYQDCCGFRYEYAAGRFNEGCRAMVLPMGKSPE